MKKIIIFISFFSLLSVFTVPSIVKAEPTKNPIFVTTEKVQELIQKAMDLLSTDIDSLKTRITYLENEINLLNTEVDNLKAQKNDIIGSMQDPNAPQLGLITFSGNSKEYHFWFTPNTNVLDYYPGHTYHLIYNSAVTDPSGWCWQESVPNRPPYNLFISAGTMVYFKIYDVTTGQTPCF